MENDFWRTAFKDGFQKRSGFRLQILNPVEIWKTAVNAANTAGDLTVNDFKLKHKNQTDMFLNGQSNKLKPAERIWDFKIGDQTFAEMQFIFESGYSVELGEHALMSLHFSYSDEAVMSKKHFVLANKGLEIAKTLREKGIKTATYSGEPGGLQKVTIPASEASNTIEIYLGWKNMKDIYEKEQGYVKDLPDYALAIQFNEGFSLNQHTFIANLQAFQNVASCAVDTFYEMFEEKSPNVAMQIDDRYEI